LQPVDLHGVTIAALIALAFTGESVEMIVTGFTSGHFLVSALFSFLAARAGAQSPKA
jgi:hypothetical protein